MPLVVAASSPNDPPFRIIDSALHLGVRLGGSRPLRLRIGQETNGPSLKLVPLLLLRPRELVKDGSSEGFLGLGGPSLLLSDALAIRDQLGDRCPLLGRQPEVVGDDGTRDARGRSLPLQVELLKPFELCRGEMLAQPLCLMLVDYPTRRQDSRAALTVQCRCPALQLAPEGFRFRDELWSELKFLLNLWPREQEDQGGPASLPVSSEMDFLPPPRPLRRKATKKEREGPND